MTLCKFMTCLDLRRLRAVNIVWGAAFVAMGCAWLPGMSPSSTPVESPDHEAKPWDKGMLAAEASQAGDVAQEQEKLLDVVEARLTVVLQLTEKGKQDDTRPARANPNKSAKNDDALPFSEAVRSVRAKRIAMALKSVPEKEQDEKGLVQLDVDAFQASLKSIPPAAWRKDREGLMAAQNRWNIVGAAVSQASLAVIEANMLTQVVNVRAMVVVATMKKHRDASGASWSGEDRAAVKRLLVDCRRSSTAGALATGLLAGYEGVINDNKDPKALDVYAAKTLAGFPGKLDVTDADVQAYVDAIDATKLKDAKARYEAMLRETYGDLNYERKYKGDLDKAFAQLDAEDYARTTRAAGSDPSPKATAAAPTPGPTGRAGTVLKLATAASHGDVSGALDSAADLAPADSPVRHSLKGVSALMKGDAKGALNEALNLAPDGGPVKDGIASALSLFN
jgi:hypothetical protein